MIKEFKDLKRGDKITIKTREEMVALCRGIYNSEDDLDQDSYLVNCLGANSKRAGFSEQMLRLLGKTFEITIVMN